MSDAQYYRRQEEFCTLRAEAAVNQEEKDRWLKLARQWRELAEEAEFRAGGCRPSREPAPTVKRFSGHCGKREWHQKGHHSSRSG